MNSTDFNGNFQVCEEMQQNMEFVAPGASGDPCWTLGLAVIIPQC